MKSRLPLSYEWTRTVTGIVSGPIFARPYCFFIHADEAGHVLYNRPSTETRKASYAPDSSGTFFVYEERSFEFHDAAGGFTDRLITLGDRKSESEAQLTMNMHMLVWINSHLNVRPSP